MADRQTGIRSFRHGDPTAGQPTVLYLVGNNSDQRSTSRVSLPLPDMILALLLFHSTPDEYYFCRGINRDYFRRETTPCEQYLTLFQVWLPISFPIGTRSAHNQKPRLSSPGIYPRTSQEQTSYLPCELLEDSHPSTILSLNFSQYVVAHLDAVVSSRHDMFSARGCNGRSTLPRCVPSPLVCRFACSRLRIGKLTRYSVTYLRHLRDFFGAYFRLTPDPKTSTVRLLAMDEMISRKWAR